MTRVQILYWQDVPSVVKASDESGEQKRQLSEWFQLEIDRRAMAQGLVGSDAYLEAWRWGEAEERDGSVADVLEAVAAELEASRAAR